MHWCWRWGQKVVPLVHAYLVIGIFMVQAHREFSILTKLGSRDGSGLAPSRGRHFSHLPQGPHLISFQAAQPDGDPYSIAFRAWAALDQSATVPVLQSSDQQSAKRKANDEPPESPGSSLEQECRAKRRKPRIIICRHKRTHLQGMSRLHLLKLLLCCFAAFVRQTRFELPARQAAGTLSLCTLRALLSTPSALCSLTLALSPSGVGDCAADGRDLSSMALIAYHPVLAQPPGSQF